MTHTILYGFTQQESHPVPPYTNMDSTKTKAIFTNHLVLESYKNQDYKVKHTIPTTHLLLETLSRSTYTNTFTRGKKTLYLQTKEFKLRPSQLQHLTEPWIPSQKEPAQEHLKVFKKNFQKLSLLEKLYAPCMYKG